MENKNLLADLKIAVIGLGYVGLPLAVAAGKHFPTVGFDINAQRIQELESGVDVTREMTGEELFNASSLVFSHNSNDLKEVNFYIVTVPTPVDEHNNPDLNPLKSATSMISPFLVKGDIVVYESTVFPGCTEDICVPILEQGSGLIFNRDFYCGYSPERINPGDKKHRLENILKITSGSSVESAEIIDSFYRTLITAGTYKAESIMVAEAAKVIENAQRDINIAFVNELSMIFERLGLSTKQVLKAAGTKWNFLKFYPGLVGGHCIGVDPYYLTYKANELGYNPQVILSGRRINDDMGRQVALRTIKLLSKAKKLNENTNVLILGFSFKENCPDVRNTRVIDIYNELVDFDVSVDIYDPEVSGIDVERNYNISLIKEVDFGAYAAIILAVGHDVFTKLQWSDIRKQVEIIFDVKGILDSDLVDSQL